MRTISIPHSDLVASAICLGAGNFGSEIPQAEAFNLLDTFYGQGGNFLDSALVYAEWVPGGKGISEKTLGLWMKQRSNRPKIILGTKGAHPRLDTMHIARLSPQEIHSDLDESLRNLQTDWIDLYWLHRDDPGRPAGEIVETLNTAVRAGKIRAFGCSNWRAGRIHQAQAYAAQHHLQGFAADQMLWNLAVVDLTAIGDPTLAVMDQDLYALHRESGMAAVPYSSQANGLFSKLARGVPEELAPLHQGMYRSPENHQRLERAQQLAHELSLSLTQVVLGYLLSQPFPTLPIIGAKRPAQLLDSLSAGDVQLTSQQVGFLENRE
jgi:aryl-alcohol dehydrogenase-like predicted oxidoreductase